MRAGLVQLTVTDDPEVNLPVTLGLVRQAAAAGAGFVLTPELTNGLSSSRARQRERFRKEEADQTLAALREQAQASGIWLLVGSLGLLTDDPDGRFANRSLLIGPDGAIAARYDKIHMFDVSLENGESWRESRIYRPGDEAVVVETPLARIGLSICYDLRFPRLFRAMSQAGAEILCVPAAFTRQTGKAHWKALLIARAIECGAFVIAAAQGGVHEDGRETFGHSLIVSPWGDILTEARGDEPCVILADIDPARVAKARRQIPSLALETPFKVLNVEA